jgi:hypothetical protein
VTSGKTRRTLAMGIAGAIAMGATSPVSAESLSNRKTLERIAANDATPPGGFLTLSALSRNSTVTPASHFRNYETGASTLDAYILSRRARGLARNDNKGPDDYYAPRYRKGKCVDDEGNTLWAAPAWGGVARRMEGKSLKRALASLCWNAAL